MEPSLATDLGSVDLKPLEKILKKYSDKRGILIPLLQETQKLYGYLPQVAIIKIADSTNNDISQVYGVATFYAQFRLKPVGKHIIRVCHGTACHVSGARRITESCEDQLGVHDGETTNDRKFTLESVACLGCCSLAPVMMVDQTTFGRLNDREVKKVIDNLKK